MSMHEFYYTAWCTETTKQVEGVVGYDNMMMVSEDNVFTHSSGGPVNIY